MKKQALKFVGLLSIALAVVCFAPQRAAADEDDPPGRVARLSYTHGAVSFSPAGTEDWVNAVVNRPITTGDKLWTDDRARAELHIGSAVIRLSDHTGFSFLNLTDNVSQIRVTEGTLNVRVRRLDDDETFEIDTPNLAFSILRPGSYKIDVNEAGDTTVVVVRDGEGEVTGGGSAYTVHPRQIGTFAGIDQLDADVQRFGEDEDDFDRWCGDRDRREDRSVSSRYVSRDVIGYEDLDDYGGWRPVPGYGNVWFPHTTVVDWAPYRYGHWVWISPWGWTWVDDEPWGFAPFHYGRWVVVRGVWGWVPCPPRSTEVEVAYVRPVYAPALVAWVGGPRFSMAIAVGGGGGGGVAWFPLGPREVYVPSYHVSRTYVNNVNVSNTTVNNTYVTNVYNTTVVNQNVNVQNNTTNNVHINNIKYVNQSVPGAVTATSHEAFVSAQPISRHMVKVDSREVVNAPVATASAPVAVPPKQAVLGAGEPAKVRPPVAMETRAVVAKTAPPPPPASFERQSQLIKANGGRPVAISEIRERQPERVQATPAPVRIAPPARPATPEDTRANQPGNMRNNPGNRPGAANNPPPPANQGNRQDNPPAMNQNNRPGAANNPAPPANQGNRQDNPPAMNQNNRPGAANNPPPANQGNRPDNAPANAGNAKPSNDRPPSSRPADTRPDPRGDTRPDTRNVNPQLEQKQQQQVDQLRQKQDQERQRVEQQPQQERQRLEQKNADDRRQQQVQQKQQQQQPQQQPQQQLQPQQERQRLEQKNADDRHPQQVQQKQQQERPKPSEKPKDKEKDKEKDKDKPPHR